MLGVLKNMLLHKISDNLLQFKPLTIHANLHFFLRKPFACLIMPLPNLHIVIYCYNVDGNFLHAFFHSRWF
jgi:hypothetical protein